MFVMCGVGGVGAIGDVVGVVVGGGVCGMMLLRSVLVLLM